MNQLTFRNDISVALSIIASYNQLKPSKVETMDSMLFLNLVSMNDLMKPFSKLFIKKWCIMILDKLHAYWQIQERDMLGNCSFHLDSYCFVRVQ